MLALLFDSLISLDVVGRLGCDGYRLIAVVGFSWLCFVGGYFRYFGCYGPMCCLVGGGYGCFCAFVYRLNTFTSSADCSSSMRA